MDKTTTELSELPIEEQEKFVALVVNILISANHTIFQVERLKHKHVWLKELKNYGSLFMKRLMRVERDFDTLANPSNNMVEFYEGFHDFMAEVNTIDMAKIDFYTDLIRAAKKEEKAMMGITKKVLER